MMNFGKIFKENTSKLGESASILNKHRNVAMDAFLSSDLPDKSNEKYKYSDIKKLFETVYQHRFEPKKFDFELEDVFRCDVPNLDTDVVVLVNGFYAEDQKIMELSNGALVGSLDEAAKKYPELLEKHYGSCANYKDCSLVALNTAFAQDGVFFYVPNGVVIEKPIQIINLLIDDNSLMVQPRNLFLLGENSQAKVVICDHTLSAQKFITNSVTEIILSENCVFDYYKMQNEHNDSIQLSSTYIRQKRSSVLHSNNISLHGGFIRNNLFVKLEEEYCEANLDGICLADKMQHVDNYTYIDHAVPNCNSSEHYKSIIDDMASVAFNGRVLVRPDAQNTNAFQANNNIALTQDAKVYTKPQLEIYADDVKCSHGATVGQLDYEALFYLKSRGIGHKEAMTLLMYGFAYEVISKIRIEPLTEKISNLVDKRLRGEFSRCNHCVIRCC